MNTKKSRCSKYNGDVTIDSKHCPKCSTSLNFLKMSSSAGSKVAKQELTKVPVKPMEINYVTQIVSSGIRPDSVYETKILLGPEVDLSSIKITVKGNNLRVNMSKPLEEQFAKQLPDISERSVFGNLIKRVMKHCENLLIPEGIDNAKVRAIVDNMIMDKLPHHCQENSVTLKQNDYMNFEMMTMNGHKMSFNFIKIPNFYVFDDKEYYAAEMKTEGLKVGTATLATENMLNIKLHSSEEISNVRNINFLIPPEADAKEVSIEIVNDTILMRAPVKKKHI
ncbi:unnamed protein product [Heterotrigona itama]|uniref:SHSP domain-containing protein n=1 Tax=Heterotrigona itama TaxID=395501 RepID=A0A6V7H989_9HYME|nr:unnamed protein product [Heterotrigona itama]